MDTTGVFAIFSLEKGAMDIKSITDGEAEALCQTLRERIIHSVAHTGGHLASNLGAVEITVAIHRVFDTGKDRLVFDVGHQCYAHKILTGRGPLMDTLRAFGGISGFPKPNESDCDAFIAGHASNSISVATGMAHARTLLEEDYSVLALIGDGALSGGLAYEGLSDAGNSEEPLIVILNDNGMSITKSVGGIAQHLAQQRLQPQYLRFKKFYRRFMKATFLGRAIYRITHDIKKAIKGTLLPCSMFEDMGFHYMGPVDGHDVAQLTKLLRDAKERKCPVLLHIHTTKGKGYLPAEKNPDQYHGVGAFSVETGAPRATTSANFSHTFGEVMCEEAAEDRRVCAITAAMEDGTGLAEFRRRFPERFFDVGIAEGHAVSMAAGMAKQGLIPVFAVYSSFLQRAYDMLIHDVSIQNLHVVFGVDRAGLVGDDGETHHGVFDVAFLSSVLGMTILCPSNFAELRTMMRHALYGISGPVAVRYPRGGEGEYTADAGLESTATLRRGKDITLLGYGTMIGELLICAKLLTEHGIRAEVIKLNRIAPLDLTAVLRSAEKTGRILVAEEVVAAGCVGGRIAAAVAEHQISLSGLALCNLGDQFVTQGKVSELRKLCALDGESLYKKALEVCGHGEETAGCPAV